MHNGQCNNRYTIQNKTQTKQINGLKIMWRTQHTGELMHRAANPIQRMAYNVTQHQLGN